VHRHFLGTMKNILSTLFLFVTVTTSLADTTRIACVGNSITDGTNLTGTVRDTGRYPYQLQNLLGKAYKVVNCGKGGATALKKGDMPYWTYGADQFKVAMSLLPNIVIIELGTNDSKPVNWPNHKNEFIGDYKALVDTFATLPSRPKVWVCLPPPAFSTQFTIDSAVIRYEVVPKIKSIAFDKGLPVIDLFTLMTPYGARFPDGIHPDPQGYSILARKVQQMLLADTLKIVKSKNRLAAPYGFASYQWYRRGKPVPQDSGGTAEVFMARDTGLYKVAVGLSVSSGDILVTDQVPVSQADLTNAIKMLPLQGFTRTAAPAGEVSRYRLDGRKIASVQSLRDRPLSTHFKTGRIDRRGILLITLGDLSFILLKE
jgi:acyl-CoA thioesterase I